MGFESEESLTLCEWEIAKLTPVHIVVRVSCGIIKLLALSQLYMNPVFILPPLHVPLIGYVAVYSNPAKQIGAVLIIFIETYGQCVEVFHCQSLVYSLVSGLQPLQIFAVFCSICPQNLCNLLPRWHLSAHARGPAMRVV